MLAPLKKGHGKYDGGPTGYRTAKQIRNTDIDAYKDGNQKVEDTKVKH
jgi:hypothetical protein